MFAKLSSQCRPSKSVGLSNTKFLPSPVPPTTFYVPVDSPSSLKSMKSMKSIPSDCCSMTETANHQSKDPRTWGPHLWYYLHTSAANYPTHPSVTEQRAMKQWLKTLPVTIPCENCSYHYARYVKEHEAMLDKICQSRDQLFEFFVDLHNQVNRRNRKPIFTYEQARSLYMK
jgi:hypothetical protein